MNSGLFVIGLLVAVAFVATATKNRSVDGITNQPVTLDNIHRGVANGWYTCELMRIDGAPAVRLSGNKTDGTFYSGIYPITEADWQTLKAEGYDEA